MQVEDPNKAKWWLSYNPAQGCYVITEYNRRAARFDDKQAAVDALEDAGKVWFDNCNDEAIIKKENA